MSDLVEWARRLRFELARASGWERPAIIKKALGEAGPLAAQREKVIAIAYDLARQYEITSEQIKAAGKSSRPLTNAGFFQSLPTGDDPRAA